jgi:hypothetical protein
MASDSGIIPATVASAVIRIGRSRRSPASIIASWRISFGAETLIGVQQQNAVLRHDADDHDQAHERRDVERRSGDQQRKKTPEVDKQRRRQNRRRRRKRCGIRTAAP